MADWSRLPRDILRHITEEMVFLWDFLWFASVCKEWHSIALETPWTSPLLLLPFDNSSDTCKFFNPKRRNTIGIHLAELHNRTCVSASRGWLATLSDELDIKLLHLYTKAWISLPRHPSYEEIYPLIRPKDIVGVKLYYVQKLVLSTNPAVSPNDCFVAGICGFSMKVVFCRLGDKNWTPIDYSGCTDVIFYKNKIYAVSTNAVVISCETGQNPKVTELHGPGGPFNGPNGRSGHLIYYLVESVEGDLFYVVRYLEWLISPDIIGKRNFCRKKKFETTMFYVFKLDRGFEPSEQSHASGKRWSKVDDLGDQVLFVGRNHSFAMRAEALSCSRGNCICFTDDYTDGQTTAPFGLGWCDVGVFNMEDKSLEPLYSNAPYWRTPPIWFQHS